MATHYKYEEALTLVKHKQPILLTGERGSGKTTLAKQIADGLGLEFYSMSMTRQTTLSHLLGFMNVDGNYIKSHLRSAVEHGGLMLLDEIDASDPNVILSLNTLENGFVTFPDAIIQVHENFRLVASSNPQDDHKNYNGRAKLDASTLDRFDIIPLERDDLLERSLIDEITSRHIDLIRKCLREQNSLTYISMRDALRFQNRRNLKLANNFVKNLLSKDKLALEKYEQEKISIPEFSNLEEAETSEQLFNLMLALKPKFDGDDETAQSADMSGDYRKFD